MVLGFQWLPVILGVLWLVGSLPWSQLPHLQMHKVDRMSENLLVLMFRGFHSGERVADHYQILWIHVLENGHKGGKDHLGLILDEGPGEVSWWPMDVGQDKESKGERANDHR